MKSFDFTAMIAKSNACYLFSQGTYDPLCLLSRAYDLLSDLDFSDESVGFAAKVDAFVTKVNKALTWDRRKYDSAVEAYYCDELKAADKLSVSVLWREAVDLLDALSPVGFRFGEKKHGMLFGREATALFGWWKVGVEGSVVQ